MILPNLQFPPQLGAYLVATYPSADPLVDWDVTIEQDADHVTLNRWDDSKLGPVPALADVQVWSPNPPVTDVNTSPKPRTQALTPEELAEARAAVAQVAEQATKATNTTTLRQSVASLAEAFDAVLARLAGE